MSIACVNNVMAKVAAGKVCTAFGIRLVNSVNMVQLAKNAGFDSLFIELEHSTLTLEDASNLSFAGLALGITPIVRVPHQCGNGFVQRVLDGGAMGVIFPHISTPEEAKAAVNICKYPPLGARSMTGQLPVFSLKTSPSAEVIESSNANASTVIVMIENQEAVDRAGEIAAVPGVDVLLVGSNDLCIDLGVAGEFRGDVFKAAMEKVGAACQKHGKIMGLAGIYEQRDIHDWAINEIGVRYMLCQQDSGLIAGAAVRCEAAVRAVQKS